MGCECCEQKIYGGGEQGEQDRRNPSLECIEYVNGPDGRLYVIDVCMMQIVAVI